MPTGSGDRRLSYVFLCVTPFLVFTIAAVRALRVPGLYHALAGVQLTAVSAAVWRLGAWAIGTDAVERRRLAVAGALLVAPWIPFSLLPGVGLPQQATEAENYLRYGVLLLDGVVLAGGLIVFSEALREAGERFYSTLGFAATVVAGPLFLLWAMFPLALGGAAAQERSVSGQLPLWFTSLQGLSEILLMSAVTLTYLAAAFRSGTWTDAVARPQVKSRVCRHQSVRRVVPGDHDGRGDPIAGSDGDLQDVVRHSRVRVLDPRRLLHNPKPAWGHVLAACWRCLRARQAGTTAASPKALRGSFPAKSRRSFGGWWSLEPTMGVDVTPIGCRESGGRGNALPGVLRYVSGTV